MRAFATGSRVLLRYALLEHELTVDELARATGNHSQQRVPRRSNCGCCACRSSWLRLGGPLCPSSPARPSCRGVARCDPTSRRARLRTAPRKSAERRRPTEASRESRARPRPGACPRAFARSGRSLDRALARAGVPAVLLSLAVLAVTAVLQVAIFLASGSVALLADLIHNAGDALTAVPRHRLPAAQRPRRANLGLGPAGCAIFISACVALYEMYLVASWPPRRALRISGSSRPLW